MKKYEKLLSPIQIRGKTLKNRIISSKCALQSFTIKQAEEFYVELAKNGASTVTVAFGDYPDRILTHAQPGMKPMQDGTGLNMSDPEIRAGFKRMCQRCHEAGSLVSVSLMDIEPDDVNISDVPNWDEIPMEGDYNSHFGNKPGISVERIHELIEEFAFRCQEAKSLGFDMCTFYMSYRSSIMACSMSPLLNQRTDKYGGKTMKERATLAREVFSRIKETCGDDFLIEAQISGIEEAPGYTLDDFLDYCEAIDDLVDIVQIRGVDGSATHVNGLNCVKGHPTAIDYAEAFKKRNLRALCAPVGGFGDPDDMERFLEEGKTDLFAIARQFIADSDYYNKLLAGDGENIIPCIRCNSCHGFHTCAVNPVSGRLNDFPQSTQPKNVAVLGGGAAGMEAAITAAKRGHRVTLFEKAPVLGGQLNLASAADYKWPVKDFENYLIDQLNKSGAEVKLGAEISPEALKAMGFDAVICAIGSSAKTIPVDGADSKGVWLAEQVFNHEAEVGKKVVVIGGQDTGRDAALYLARAGHEVVLVTRNQITLSKDMHSERVEKESFNILPNFSYVDFAETIKVSPTSVTLKVQTNPQRRTHMMFGMQDMEDAKYPMPQMGGPGGPGEGPGGPGGPGAPGGPGGPGGFGGFGAPQTPPEPPVYAEKVIDCDTVVISGGRASNSIEAYKDAAPVVVPAGDAKTVGDIKKAVYSGYKAAMQL